MKDEPRESAGSSLEAMFVDLRMLSADRCADR